MPPTRLRRDRIGAGGMDEDRFKSCKIWRRPLEIRLKLWDEAGPQRTGSHPVLCGPALLEQHLQKALEPIWFQSFDLVRVVIQNFLKKPVISTVFEADE